ncbi:hypothetical protein NUM3379_09910 [Kineococcus sp. NUM-3379]
MAGTAQDRGPETGGGGTEEARARRAERVAAMQKEQRRKERARRLAAVAVVVGVLVAAGAVVAGVILNRPAPPSLAAAKTFQYTAGDHTADDVAYTENPPVGGEHDPVWQNCGIYDEPVRDENAVHSMEHGAVWITYRPDLPAEQVEQLRERVGTRQYVLLSPRADLPSPVVASAWNNQIELTGADDPRLPAFMTKFVQGPQTPEVGASCSGGEGTPTS